MRFLPLFTNRFFLVVLLISLLIVGYFIQRFSQPSSPPSATIHLSSAPITSSTDSDGDGVVDWLEDLTDSDSLNPDSFPYDIDAAKAQTITIDELLYGGPGEFTEEVVRRYLLGEGQSVTSADREQFISESSEYFISQAESRTLPPVSLVKDESVSPADLLDDFILALQHFSRQKTSFETVIFGAFGKEKPALAIAKSLRSDCLAALRTFPRRVPLEIYDSYYLVLERVTYLCEGLSLSVLGNTTSDYFYVIRLLTTGRLFKDLDHSPDRSLDEKFIDHISFLLEVMRDSQ